MFINSGLIAVTIMHIQMAWSQNEITLVVDTKKSYQCGETLHLKCTYTGSSACCGSNKILRVDNTPVLTNDNESPDVGKYEAGEINTSGKYFIFIIKDVQRTDFDKTYSCRYGFDELLSPLTFTDTRCSPKCFECGVKCIGFTAAGMALGLVLLAICSCFGIIGCQSCCFIRKYPCIACDGPGDYDYKFFGTEYRRDGLRWTLTRAFTISIISCIVCYLILYGISCTFVIGIHCEICDYAQAAYIMFCGFGIFIFFSFSHWTLKFGHVKDDDTFPHWQYGLYMVLTAFIVPIPFLVLYEKCLKANSGTDRKKDGADATEMI